MLQFRVWFTGLSPAARRSSTERLVTLAVLVAVLVGRPGPALAQSSGARAAGDNADLIIPGGVAALSKILNLQPRTDRYRVVLDVVRVLYDTSWGTRGQGLDKLGDLSAYLAGIERIDRSLKELAAVPGSGGAVVAPGDGSEQVRHALESIGLKVWSRDGKHVVEADRSSEAVRRRVLARMIGVDAERVAAELKAGRPVSLSIPADSVPTPIPLETWSEFIPGKPRSGAELFGGILLDRRAALLYYGLTACDPQTRAFLVSHPQVLKEIDDEGAAAFSVAGRSIHIRDRRLVVPGGTEAQQLWEFVVGEALAQPESFVLAVIKRDEGRLAYFFDTIAHLDEPQLSFALGNRIADASTRRQRFLDLYRVFVRADPAWRIADRPFARNANDAAMVLGQVNLESGQLAGPRDQRFWAEALKGRASMDSGSRADARPGGPVDAAWLLDLIVSEAPEKRADRLAAFLFGQRVFGGVGPAEIADAAAAIQGFLEYPSLALTMERAGITSPAAYRAMMSQAVRLASIGDHDRGLVALAQFQSALALVERARFARALTIETASTLVTELAAQSIADGEYQGRIAHWLNDRLLPALAQTASGEGNQQERLLDGLAGQGLSHSQQIEWEGVAYRLDAALASRERMRDLVDRSAANRFDVALHLSTVLQGLSHDSHQTAPLRELTGELTSAAEALQGLHGVGFARIGSVPAEIIREAIKALARLESLDSSQAGEVLNRLQWAADVALADALVRTVYLVALGSLGATDQSLVDLADMHDFGFALESKERLEQEWRMPQTAGGEGVPLHLEGAVLGLDLALARFSPRRLSEEPPLHPPALSSNLQTAFIRNATLMNPFDLADDDRDLLAGAIERGRTRVKTAGHDLAALDSLAGEIALSEWRREQLPWIVSREPERLESAFSRLDLFWLGRPEIGRAKNIDAWGTAEIGGCLCVRLPRPEPWEDFGGRPMSGQMASRVPDLTFRVAEALAAHKLPAFLARDILAVATTDLIEGVQPAYDDDWASLVEYVGGLSDERMEDYISSVAAQGPLVPVTDGSHKN